MLPEQPYILQMSSLRIRTVCVVTTTAQARDALASAFWMVPESGRDEPIGQTGATSRALVRVNRLGNQRPAVRMHGVVASAVALAESSALLTAILETFPDCQCFVFSPSGVTVGTGFFTGIWTRVCVQASAGALMNAMGGADTFSEEERSAVRVALERQREQVPFMSAIARAERASTIAHEREMRRRANERVEIPPSWEAVLSQKAQFKEGGAVCVVCMDAPSTIVLVDCDHAALCDTCAAEWAQRAHLDRRCPLCRTPTTQIARVLL